MRLIEELDCERQAKAKLENHLRKMQQDIWLIKTRSYRRQSTVVIASSKRRSCQRESAPPPILIYSIILHFNKKDDYQLICVRVMVDK